jgi:hypothetical protein
MRNLALLASLALLATLSGCKTLSLLSPGDQQAVQSRHHNQTLFAKQPWFVGPFYSYDDRQYVSERAFDERILLESTSGEPIVPLAPTGIVPMGRRLRIRQVEFPTGGVVAARKLKSPRHFTWVILEDTEQPDGLPYVLVLTQSFRTPEAFAEALALYLVEEDPRPAFGSRRPEVRSAIERKLVVQGMRADELMRSRGYPDQLLREQVGGVQVETWRYAVGREVILKDEAVDSFKGFPVLPIQEAPTENEGG